MRHIKEVLRLHHELKLSVRQLARATGLARSTVADYLRRATLAALPWPLPEELDEPQLWAKLFEASVETAVQIVQREILGALRDHTFFSLGALNQEIGRLRATINARPFTQKGGCREQLFETEERSALTPIPSPSKAAATA